MKEFIEKLIARLEEQAEQSCMLGDDDVWYDGMESGFLGAIEIVNELAEEHKHCTLCYLQSPCEYQNENAILPSELYNGGCCEWRNGTSGIFKIKTSCRNSIDVNYGYEFCPYCGKKIKVVE